MAHKTPQEKALVLIGSLVILIGILFLGEALIRTAISMNVSSFRAPGLYTDYYSDDDYWKLHHKWFKEYKLPKRWVDPLLGWSPPKTSSNPLGIETDSPYVPDFHRKTALFYGNSFVDGVMPTEEQIPQQLDHLLPDYAVYNYGVGGYGVDQIFLRFKKTYSAFRKPLIIFGILTTDLDRCVLTVRTAKKPYFVIEDNKLIVRGVPIDSNLEQWLQQNPPRIKSYFLSFIIQKLRQKRLTYKQTEKKQINALIIEEIVRESRDQNLPLLFVIFYPEKELRKISWRELFLKAQFDRLAVPYADTKVILLRKAEQESVDISKYYHPKNGHLNELGNMVIAEALRNILTAEL